MFTTRKENENAKFKTILSSKINSAALQAVFSRKSPEKRGREMRLQYYPKACEINEKKIEMLDFDKNKKLLEDYYRWIDSRRK